MTECKAKIEVIRNGAPLMELHAVGYPKIDMTSSAEIKMTLTGTFLVPEQNIDYLRDRLLVTITADGVSWALGRYIITTATVHRDQYSSTVEITAYDLTYLPRRSKIEQRVSLAAGTKYTDAVRSLLVDSGIDDMLIKDSSAVLATVREDWEPGTPRLTIANTLLAEINYHSLYEDPDGYIAVAPIAAPSISGITKRYSAGEYSILYPAQDIELDYFDRPNVFVRYIQNGEIEVMRATAVNDSPGSPFSTVNASARVLDIAKLDNTADLATLQGTVDALKEASLLASNKVSFMTGPARHGLWEIIALDDGVYQETDWSIELSPSMPMTHKGKQVIGLAG